MPPRPLYRNRRKREEYSGWLPESLRQYLVRFLKRIQGVMIMAAAVVFTLLLYSYHPLDPSWNSAATSGETRNWLGLPGSYTADLIWQFLGVSGFLAALVLFIWGWLIATQREINFVLWRSFALLVSMLSLATGLALAPHLLPETEIPGKWSGISGQTIGRMASRRLPAEFGGIVLAVPMFVISLGSLYLAAALSLDEWHRVLRILKTLASGATGLARSGLSGFLRRLIGKTADLEDATGELYEEMPDSSETKEKIAAFRPKAEAAKKPRGPLVQRPSASAQQARLALIPDRQHPLPPLDLLHWPDSARLPMDEVSEEALEKNAKLLESVLADFGVYGQITKVSPGPVVTLYELEPSAGTRSSRVISLADDIARNMSASSVRVAVVPGRNVIGIELPNRKREPVYLRELLSGDAYTDYKGLLPLVLGKDIAGNTVIADLTRMPHLLIAGTTGSGKSVALNSMILSLIYKLPPEKCRFIMVDPKMLELSLYEGIPHLLTPVVTEPKKAIMALKWAVREMEERYRAMTKLGVRNIEGYNIRLREAAKNNEKLTRTVQTGFDRETGKPIYEEQPLDLTPLPSIVVIVDEMADLMMVAGKEIEGAVQRLSQMARAADIHLIMATQRPSVDVITGTIKANFPTRISFQVTSKIDSRTILGEQGAEQLLGHGDMLFMESGKRVIRVHGPLVTDDEVEAIVKFLRSQGEPEYLEEITEEDDEAGDDLSRDREKNELYDKAVDIVLRERKASISFVQRHLQIGYNRAATLIERMEKEGVISSPNHVGKREVLGRKG